MNVTNFQHELQSISPVEIVHLSVIYIFSHFLLLSLLTSFPQLDAPRFRRRRVFLEATVLSLPFLCAVTVLEVFSISIPYVLLIVAMHIVLTYSRAYPVLKWPEIVFHSKPMPVRLPFLTNLFANVILKISIVILAVDFQIFPTRLAKSKVYGWTLMDTGVAYFISLNALLAPESRQDQVSSDCGLKNLKKSLKSSVHLFVLGFLRILMIELTGYHQEITEYGLHWNFFITLGLTKIISSLVVYFFPSPGKFSMILAFCHQLLLSLGLNKFILGPERRGFFNANKEGIFSLPGYVSIFLSVIPLARIYFEKRDRRSNLDNIFVMCDFGLTACLSGFVSVFAHYYIEPISRRECNLAFICASICCLCLIAMTELLVEILIDVLQYFGIMKKPPLVKSLLNEALARNGLVTFLFANVFTGLVNFLLEPKARGSFLSMIILVFYCYSICFFSLYCHEIWHNFKYFLFFRWFKSSRYQSECFH